jgi:hypothetical protein
VQQLGRDGIEEGLGQFGLVVVGQQADVVQLGLLPGVHADSAAMSNSPAGAPRPR